MQARRRAHAPGEDGQVTFNGRLTRDAETDLSRLFDILLECELFGDGGDLGLPTTVIAALRTGIAALKTSPVTCRKAGQSPFLRELIVPFGRSGHVALFEIEDVANVAVLTVRHQVEDDYHCRRPLRLWRAGGRSGDTVNQVANTVIGSPNEQVNAVDVVSLDSKPCPWLCEGRHCRPKSSARLM
jgi:hypothetical protein